MYPQYKLSNTPQNLEKFLKNMLEFFFFFKPNFLNTLLSYKFW